MFKIELKNDFIEEYWLKIVEKIEKQGYQFTNKVDDIDTLYFLFSIDNKEFILYGHFYLGIEIYSHENFSDLEKEKYQFLIKKICDF